MTDLGGRDREGSGAVLIAKAEELAHGQSLVFELIVDDLRQTGFVLRHGDRRLAYLNRCPHQNVDLDFGDARMYDERIDGPRKRTRAPQPTRSRREPSGVNVNHGPALLVQNAVPVRRDLRIGPFEQPGRVDGRQIHATVAP